jgi:hypothetical protein
MIDWTTSAYKSQGYYAAQIQWIDVQCYDNSNLSYTAVNGSSSSNSSRLARREEESLWERSLLGKRADTFNSYLWGCE